MLVYNIQTGEILGWIQADQDYKVFYGNYPSEILDNLNSILIDMNDLPSDLENYIVIGETFQRRSEEEIREIQLYNKILTEEERILESMKPSMEEVEEAEMTIKILSILEGVI